MRTKAIKNKWGLDRSAQEEEIKADTVWRLLAAAESEPPPLLFFVFVTTAVAAVDFVGAVLGRHHTKRLN